MNGGGGWWEGPSGPSPTSLLFFFPLMVTYMIDIVSVTALAVALYYLILFTEFLAVWLLTL